MLSMWWGILGSVPSPWRREERERERDGEDRISLTTNVGSAGPTKTDRTDVGSRWKSLTNWITHSTYVNVWVCNIDIRNCHSKLSAIHSMTTQRRLFTQKDQLYKWWWGQDNVMMRTRQRNGRQQLTDGRRHYPEYTSAWWDMYTQHALWWDCFKNCYDIELFYTMFKCTWFLLIIMYLQVLFINFWLETEDSF